MNVGPVSVAFDVASDFRLYSHEVYDSFDEETNFTVCSSDPMSINQRRGCSGDWRDEW